MNKKTLLGSSNALRSSEIWGPRRSSRRSSKFSLDQWVAPWGPSAYIAELSPTFSAGGKHPVETRTPGSPPGVSISVGLGPDQVCLWKNAPGVPTQAARGSLLGKAGRVLL